MSEARVSCSTSEGFPSLLVLTYVQVESARDLTNKTNIPLSTGHYLDNLQLLTDQWTPYNYKDPNLQRVYLKDIDCPATWAEKLEQQIPPVLFYLNESTSEAAAPNPYEPDSHESRIRKGMAVAKAGDLMSSLPPAMRAENMMCYIGHEGTYTPSHREMCASLGQNIMVEASSGLSEKGKPTKKGSSIWFMTETKDRHLVSEYWLSTLGHDIEIEDHFAQINAWKAAPFKTYIVEQKPGDFILIPPLAPHQVWNRGTRTMKAAWNRTTIETLELALEEAVPRARMVCRDEQYKNKAIVYYTLKKYSKLLKQADAAKQEYISNYGRKPTANTKVRQLQKDFRRLFVLFNKIMVAESFHLNAPEKKVEYIPFDSNITCSYCRGNIFNRFLTCRSCVGKLPDGEDDTYDICMECYAIGRSCACISKLDWVEQWKWSELTENFEKWRQQVITQDGKITDNTPRSLELELKIAEKRSLAQICQDELKRRPFLDPKKQQKEEVVLHSDGEDEEDNPNDYDASGRLRKNRKKKRSDKWLREHRSCHVCFYREPSWKQAECTSCGACYCYGSLFRGFDIMPIQVMQDPAWKCPKCRGICSCGKCSKDPRQKPYVPNTTLLGHDTKKIADPRSMESLVDFSISNRLWLRKAGEDHAGDTQRLMKRQKEAQVAKSKDDELNEEHYAEAPQNDQDPANASLLALAAQEGLLQQQEMHGNSIDPALGDTSMMNDSMIDPTFRERNTIREPQFTIPANAVYRNQLEDQYQPTEAITFDYPELPQGDGMGYQQQYSLPAYDDLSHGDYNPEPQSHIAPMMLSNDHDPQMNTDAPVIPGDEPSLLGNTKGKKRKRASEATHTQMRGDTSLVFSGNAESPARTSRGPVRGPQKKKARTSKKNGSKMLKLPVAFEKLASFEETYPSTNPDPEAPAAPIAVPAPLLESDIPTLASNIDTILQPRSMTRRKDPAPRLEQDDEFRPGRARRRGKGTLAQEPGGTPQNGISADPQGDHNSTPTGKTSRRASRKAAEYIGGMSGDDLEDDDEDEEQFVANVEALSAKAAAQRAKARDRKSSKWIQLREQEGAERSSQTQSPSSGPAHNGKIPPQVDGPGNDEIDGEAEDDDDDDDEDAEEEEEEEENQLPPHPIYGAKVPRLTLAHNSPPNPATPAAALDYSSDSDVNNEETHHSATEEASTPNPISNTQMTSAQRNKAAKLMLEIVIDSEDYDTDRTRPSSSSKTPNGQSANGISPPTTKNWGTPITKFASFEAAASAGKGGGGQVVSASLAEKKKVKVKKGKRGPGRGVAVSSGK